MYSQGDISFVSEWQSDKCREVGNFAPFLPLNWLPWQRPLRNQKKTGPDQENSRKYLPSGEKIVKIGAVDTEIALLRVKKEEITEGKIYSPFGKFAERAK